MIDVNVRFRSHRKEARGTQDQTLDLEQVRAAASDIQADANEVLKAARVLPKARVQAIIEKTKKLQEIVQEIQYGLDNVVHRA